MAIQRIATTGKSGKGYAVLIRTGKGTYVITPAALKNFDTSEKIMTELGRLAALRSDALPAIFIHQNQDSTLAIAAGEEPDVWPEDAPPEESLSRLEEVRRG